MNIKDAVSSFVSLFSHKKIVVIVQSRLSSTRLPRKALLPLGSMPVLQWVLNSMKKVKASAYYLACDTESEEEYASIAKKCGWKIYGGSQSDVLGRFCDVIQKSGADYIVRATGDNPFLFYEAAELSLERFLELNIESKIDYFTFTGLPHGSGIEVMRADSLLAARDNTDLPYDHEHVGPALYNHKDKFNCVFEKSPVQFNYPDLRSTIDTAFDYRRAQQVVHILSGKNTVKEPFTTEQIISALKNESILYPILLIPSVKKGQGTGHLRRCLDLALKLNCDIYIPLEADLPQIPVLVQEAREKGLEDFQIIRNLVSFSEYSLVVTDLFKTDESLTKIFTENPHVSILQIDEGGNSHEFADYLLDIIPSAGIDRQSNYSQSGFIQLPENKRKNSPDKIYSALVCFGGEDPSGLSFPCTLALARCGIYVSVISKNEDDVQKINLFDEEIKKYIKIIGPVENLKDKLCEYDLVVTHYGLTAYEASASGCAVILASTTNLHSVLAQKYGFARLEQNELDYEHFSALLSNPLSLVKNIQSQENFDLSLFVREISKGTKLMCPVCRSFKSTPDPVLARIRQRTFRRCSDCSMIYISYSALTKTEDYSHDYFYSDYQKQYGKTYLEDFPSIKAQCIRRLSVIDYIYRSKHFKKNHSPSVLDIGCAMGPFLDAANDSLWQVYGADISAEAVDYVKNTLNFPAVCTAFPDSDFESDFGVDKFDAVTMWYVIEHFQDLDKVLKKVSSLVKKNGIFAFSTPSGSGVSAKYNRENFFLQSPGDHYSIWEIKNARNILKKYGFKIVKIVPTGIHPERFPSMKKKSGVVRTSSFKYKFLKDISKIFKLGDTFEIYCIKTEK